MNKYIEAISKYFKSKADYKYEDPMTGEVFTYKRRGVYRKNGRVLVLVSRGGEGPTKKQR